MPKYLLLAEKISKNIKQDSSSNYLGRVKLEVRHKPPN
ncbi:hypothetical protein BA71_00262 [Acinetobacter baumannii LAC-4]|nr:hypothetical protein ABLAC_26220 [Acinetobacter baumannii LAC-4]EZF20174.1 hypothetical protein BA71_00262 [Acinetobacter baumannii LAC-4]